MAGSKNSKPAYNDDEKNYFQKVLDEVASLNTLFTFAIFIGLSFAQPGNVQSLDDDPSCHPDTNIRKRLVALEIVSFSCFASSGVLAKTVKVFLYTSEKHDSSKEEKEKPHQKGISLVGFYLSIYGTMVGCLLLLLAMVDIVQIKLGRLSCYSRFTMGTVSIMVGTIGFSLLIYFATVTYGLAKATIKMVQKGKTAPVRSGAENV